MSAAVFLARMRGTNAEAWAVFAAGHAKARNQRTEMRNVTQSNLQRNYILKRHYTVLLVLF